MTDHKNQVVITRDTLIKIHLSRISETVILPIRRHLATRIPGQIVSVYEYWYSRMQGALSPLYCTLLYDDNILDMDISDLYPLVNFEVDEIVVNYKKESWDEDNEEGNGDNEVIHGR